MYPSRFMLLFAYDTYLSSIYTDSLKKNFIFFIMIPPPNIFFDTPNAISINLIFPTTIRKKQHNTIVLLLISMNTL